MARAICTEGLSSWLFVGQLAGSIGFVVYSWLVRNWVFVFTNSAAILLTAVIGQLVYRRNVRLERGRVCPPGRHMSY